MWPALTGLVCALFFPPLAFGVQPFGTALPATAEGSGVTLIRAEKVVVRPGEVLENVNFESGAILVSLCPESARDIAVEGNRGALLGAIENVVRNAVRHSPVDGAVTVSLSVANADACIDIEDTGPGVPEEELESLFEPFFRTREAAENGGDGGSGLGLAIARRAVELHGGRIEAHNREGGGLGVKILLPLR